MAKRKTPPPPALPHVALYLRVSTGRQAESDLSIPDQGRQLRAYCEAKSWPVAEEFIEPGNTATDDRRPAFQQMIDAAMAKPPPFQVILVHSFSRFFRDQFLFEFYARKLAKNGVRIVSITQEVGDDPMTLRTGKGSTYRYYTCCTKARQGATGCEGLSVRMDLLDASVIDHLETRLLNPKRLATMMDNILDRRSEWIERRHRHVADLRKRATEAEQRLQRLYLSIEQGIVDPTDRSLKQRVAELKAHRDAAEGDAQRAASAIDKITPALTPDLLRRFSEATRQMFRDNEGGYRRDLIRAVAQKVELVSPFEAEICRSKIELLRTLASNNGVNRRL